MNSKQILLNKLKAYCSEKNLDKKSLKDVKEILEKLSRYGNLELFAVENQTKFEKFSHWLLELISISYILVLGVNFFYTQHNFEGLLFNLVWLIMTVIMKLLHYICISGKKEIHAIMEWCKRQETEPISYLPEYKKDLKLRMSFIWIIAVLWIGSVIFFSEILLMMLGSILVSIVKGEYFLPCPFLLPLEDKMNIWIFSGSLLQFSILFIPSTVAIGFMYVTFLMSIVLLHFRYGNITSMIQMLGGSINEHEGKLDAAMLKTIVELQVDAELYFKNFTQLFNWFLLVVLSAIYIEAFIIFFFMNMETNILAIVMSFCLMFAEIAEFTFVLGVEVLKNKELESLEAIWMDIPWYKLKPRNRSDYLQLLTRNEIYLKAGGIFSFNFEGYLTVVKDVYAKCTILENLIAKSI